MDYLDELLFTIILLFVQTIEIKHITISQQILLVNRKGLRHSNKQVLYPFPTSLRTRYV
jgi:hypothetical protein